LLLVFGPALGIMKRMDFGCWFGTLESMGLWRAANSRG
jgi:hypothetical protein